MGRRFKLVRQARADSPRARRVLQLAPRSASRSAFADRQRDRWCSGNVMDCREGCVSQEPDEVIVRIRFCSWVPDLWSWCDNTGLSITSKSTKPRRKSQEGPQPPQSRWHPDRDVLEQAAEFVGKWLQLCLVELGVKCPFCRRPESRRQHRPSNAESRDRTAHQMGTG